jgi:CNT family concentrative nucleoside transporter
MEKLISLLGLVVMMLLAWLMSSHKKKIPWRVVVGGLLLQFIFGWIILKTAPGQFVFSGLSDGFSAMLDFVDVGSKFVFGEKFRDHYFAFKVIPTIIFFSALMSVLYHFGVMQFIVKGMSNMMQKVLGTSGAETLSAAVNVFVGQTEAPLVIKPYVPKMTDSELMAVMVGGFANVAGGVLAAFVGMGIDAGHLIASSVISAPASLVIAKLLLPEVGQPVTMGKEAPHVEVDTVNFVDALARGASDGVMLAINVAAMLIAFLAMIALFDFVLTSFGGYFGLKLSLAMILGYAFSPLAWVMGVPAQDMFSVGELLGLKMVANEFVAYERLAAWITPGSGVELTERAKIIATYALCGFANFGSIGIQIGGISPLAPNKRGVISKLAFRAMLGGTLATFMTACIAGIFL